MTRLRKRPPTRSSIAIAMAAAATWRVPWCYAAGRWLLVTRYALYPMQYTIPHNTPGARSLDYYLWHLWLMANGLCLPRYARWRAAGDRQPVIPGPGPAVVSVIRQSNQPGRIMASGFLCCAYVLCAVVSCWLGGTQCWPPGSQGHRHRPRSVRSGPGRPSSLKLEERGERAAALSFLVSWVGLGLGSGPVLQGPVRLQLQLQTTED
jgi:hypothetical protein